MLNGIEHNVNSAYGVYIIDIPVAHFNQYLAISSSRWSVTVC